MDLFKKLSEVMATDSTLAITVAKKENGLTVSVLPGNDLVKDAAKNKMVPICLSGTAEEMDEGFLGAVLQPVQKANGLLSSIKDFENAQEEAKKASAMEQKAKEEQKKVNEEFAGWLALAEKNYGEDKFKDTLTCLESAEKIAAKVNGGMAKVDAMKQKTMEALGEGTMFGAATEDKSDGKNVKLSKASKAAAAKTETAQEADEEESGDEE
ncbi:MAG: PRTRC system protein E [Prevotella sp.]|nr:PRTRC system protein E [Prevotella sp.]